MQSVRRQTTLSNEVLTTDSDRAVVGGDRRADSRHRRFRPAPARTFRSRRSMIGVRRRRRAQQRRPHAGGRPEHRRRAQRRRRVDLRRRHLERAGSRRRRRPAASAKPKSAARRSASCRRAAATRSRAPVYLSGVSSGMVGSNYSDALKAAGLTTPGVLLTAVGLHGRRRRTDQEGPPLVLRARCATRASTARFPASSRT